MCNPFAKSKKQCFSNLDPKVIEKCKHHQSIIFINEKVREKGQPKFSFHFVASEKTIKEITLLSDKKASQASDIPVTKAKITKF